MGVKAKRKIKGNFQILGLGSWQSKQAKKQRAHLCGWELWGGLLFRRPSRDMKDVSGIQRRVKGVDLGSPSYRFISSHGPRRYHLG